MSLPLERWARQSCEREAAGIFDPVASMRIFDDVNELKKLYELKWRFTQDKLERGEELLNMAEGTYGALLAYPTAQTKTTTSLSGTVNLYPNTVYTPIPANSVLGPQAYRLAIAAKLTTSTSPANIGFSPAINSSGTWTTGGTAVSGGSALGASTNVALTASITNAFYYVIGDITIRSSGTTSSIVGMFHYTSTQGTSAGLAGPAAVGTGHNLMFGGTAVTPDVQETTQSFQLGAVHTVTTITHNLEQIHFMDWN